MLPEFPEFKKLELTDKTDIEKITLKYPPYSDFNFVSMWSWDIKGEMQISKLNDNLVVRFTDYITSEPFYSFLGEGQVNETAKTLLELSKKQKFMDKLKLVPEISIQGLDKSKFRVEENRDHFDYILSLEKLADYEKSRLRGHASFKRRFLELHHHSTTTKTLNLNQVQNRVEIMTMTNIWMKNKVSDGKTFLDHLEDAVKRYLITQDQYHENFISVGIFLEGKLIAFTINEIIDKDHVVCHFMKGDNSYKGIYSYLVSETSNVLLKKGKKYINFEQDLGLPNLRQSKKTFEPVDFLKKYSVSLLD